MFHFFPLHLQILYTGTAYGMSNIPNWRCKETGSTKSNWRPTKRIKSKHDYFRNMKIVFAREWRLVEFIGSNRSKIIDAYGNEDLPWMLCCWMFVFCWCCWYVQTHGGYRVIFCHVPMIAWLSSCLTERLVGCVCVFAYIGWVQSSNISRWNGMEFGERKKASQHVIEVTNS